MAFLESPRFPDDISYGATGGPGYRTDVVQTESGWEQRNTPWSAARASYDVAHAARVSTLFQVLLKHFHSVQGRLHGFRYKDWHDFTVAAGEGVIVTNADSSKQLAKRYSAGALSTDRRISKPVSGTVTITGGGTLDYTTGLITGGSPTAWVGQFDVPVRYDIDLPHWEAISRSAGALVSGWSSILLIELRL